MTNYGDNKYQLQYITPSIQSISEKKDCEISVFFAIKVLILIAKNIVKKSYNYILTTNLANYYGKSIDCHIYIYKTHEIYNNFASIDAAFNRTVFPKQYW